MVLVYGNGGSRDDGALFLSEEFMVSPALAGVGSWDLWLHDDFLKIAAGIRYC